MRSIWLFGLIGMLLWLVAGCDRGMVKVRSANPQPEEPKTNVVTAQSPARPPVPTTADDTNAVALIKTTAGEMIVEFWPDVAPKTVKNFKTLAASGFYDGTCFHRIIKGFMIQGGDPLTKDPSKEAMWGTGDPGYKIPAEFNDRRHVRGVLSMARGGDPNSAGSQFFICLDPAPMLDNQYTAFGKLLKGEDVLLKIGDTPCVVAGEQAPSKPTVRVGVGSIKLYKRESIQ